MFAASVFRHLRVALFLVLALSGCVLAPTVDPKTHDLVCCGAYATFFGYDFSQSYEKQGSRWEINGTVSWKYLNGP